MIEREFGVGVHRVPARTRRVVAGSRSHLAFGNQRVEGVGDRPAAAFHVVEFVLEEGEVDFRMKGFWMKFGPSTFTDSLAGPNKWAAGPPKASRA